jgi:hypothetical protein
MATNLCPACGPVGAELSSRYCMPHLKEFLARCLEIPAAERQPGQADPAEWLAPVFGSRKAA